MLVRKASKFELPSSNTLSQKKRKGRVKLTPPPGKLGLKVELGKVPITKWWFSNIDGRVC